MFEGKPLRAEAFSPVGESGQHDDALRVLTWPDLVARLAASRDLRAQLAADQADAEASFDADSARILAHHEDHILPVNPDTSGNRKGIGCTPVISAETDTDGPSAETRGYT